MTGMGVYRWPPLHRPGVTRTAHHVDSRFTGPVPITIITNSQPSLTSSPHHQYALTINKSTPSHTDTPPTHRRNSASPYIRTNPAATTSQKRQAFTPRLRQNGLWVEGFYTDFMQDGFLMGFMGAWHAKKCQEWVQNMGSAEVYSHQWTTLDLSRHPDWPPRYQP
ncbi:unnamed protein product [Penicillium manginii]